MPLPDYSPRSDSFGNWYFGGFQLDSQVEAGYGANINLVATVSDWETYLDAALGSTNWTNIAPTTTTANWYFRFANPWEPSTDTMSHLNYRFWHSVQYNRNYLNTKLSGTPNGGTYGGSGFAPYGTGFCIFAVANLYGLWIVRAQNSTNLGQLTSSVNSTYYGWVKDPVFPTNTSDRIRNCVTGQGIGNSGGVSSSFLSCSGEGTVALTPVVTNSVITCQTSTPNANVTDLCVLDPAVSYLNIGSLHNSLFYPGTGLTVGQIYRIPPASDPDGNTEQNIWLCAGQVYGWNGSAGTTNAGYKLIRVWSNNIT
jgi:hypothetical protein